MKTEKWLRLSLVPLVAALVAACASIGRPEGGPRDETAPVFVRSNPAPGAVKVTNSRIDIIFDENIKLDDPSNKIVVSPAQKKAPAISSGGRRVSVELRDTLLPETTYTIDFSDAIRDLNEGNILDGFATDFATGADIDTLRISGMVFEGRTLEPAQGMVVGVYSHLDDTTLTSVPLERVAKTNQLGQFTIRGLKPGDYHVFAIDDRNHDWHWDRSENIAFYPVTVSPSAKAVEVTDTLTDSAGADSIVGRAATAFLPDDILLTWFNENYRAQYLKKYERPVRRALTFVLGARPDTLPVWTIANGPYAGRTLDDPEIAATERRAEGDSTVYWLRPAELVAQDSLLIAGRYQKTDSADRLVWQTDTLKLFFKEYKSKKQKKAEEEAANDTVPPEPVFMNLTCETKGTQDLNLPLKFSSTEPLDTLMASALRLEMQVDTLWQPVPLGAAQRDTLTSRVWTIPVKWEEDTRYRLIADSLAVSNIYGEPIRGFKQDFTTKKMSDYGSVALTLSDVPRDTTGTPLPVVVELLDNRDTPVKTVAAKGGTAMFDYLAPGKYYARAFLDVNGNGVWDTGNVADSLQAEDVFYYPKRLNVRANWDVNQSWALFETPVDLQKPLEIKKNKPKTKEPQQRQTDEDDEEYDENDPFGNGNSWGNGSQYNNAHRGNNRVTGTGGMQTVKTRR